MDLFLLAELGKSIQISYIARNLLSPTSKFSLSKKNRCANLVSQTGLPLDFIRCPHPTSHLAGLGSNRNEYFFPQKSSLAGPDQIPSRCAISTICWRHSGGTGKYSEFNSLVSWFSTIKTLASRLSKIVCQVSQRTL